MLIVAHPCSRPWGGALLTPFDVARGKGRYRASAPGE